MRFLFFLFFLTVAVPVFSQTTTPPTIFCASTDNTGDVNISFQPATNACGPFIGYVLFGATNQNGPFSVIDTIKNPNQTQYLHAGANATILDWWYVMIAVHDCPGYLFSPSDTVSEQPLLTPNLNYVTVVPGGVEINWNPSPSNNTYGYILYYDLGNGYYTHVDTLVGKNNTTFFDTSVETDTGFTTYSVVALDSCLHPSPLTGLSHNTMFLDVPDPDGCEQEVAFSWNPYINWLDSVLEYRIMLTQNSNTTEFSKVSTETTSFTFPLTEITEDSACLFIQAISKTGKISESNIVCLKRPDLAFINHIYINHLTVENDQVKVVYEVEPLAAVQELLIQRRIESAAYGTIEETTIDTATTSNPITFKDLMADVNSNSYYYRISAVDECGDTSHSTIGRTIHLIGEQGDSYNNSMSWNEFELEHADVINYKIYRRISNVFTPVFTASFNENSFSDTVINQTSTDGNFCYYVEASYRIALPGAPAQFRTSRSNIACVYQDVFPIMPKGFNPSRSGNFLKPHLPFGNFGNYTFRIFNRWGAEVFSSHQVNVGWDGTHKGVAVPQGAYVWMIQYEDENRTLVERKGSVVLIR